MKFFHLIMVISCLVGLFAHTAKAETVIVENFIGSACAALSQHEETMKQLSAQHNDDVVIITCPLDDTVVKGDYPLEACKKRMFRYLRKEFETGSSPPVVALNGRYVTAGGYRNIISSGVEMAKTTDTISNIPFKVEGTELVGSLPEGVSEGDYDLWLYAYDKEKVGSVVVFMEQDHEHNEDGSHVDPALENNEEAHETVTENMDVTYNNFVRALKKLGDWSGNPESFVIPLNGFDAEGFVVVAQEKNYGPIVAYGKVERETNLPNQ